MDSVRFGRALGIGARAAAKTLVTAVDAATAPNPSAKTSELAADTPREIEGRAAPAVRLGQKAARTTAQVRQTGKGLKRGGKRFGEAVWGPFLKLSGVLWLEFTGVFFGIFAAFAATEAWKSRGEIFQTGTNHAGHVHFLLAAVMSVVFGYFFVSSFVMANRRSRR
jgi:hypothetical protein